MALYYFHLKDGATLLDSEGCDLLYLAAVRRAAIATTTEVLGGIKVGPRVLVRRAVEALGHRWAKRNWRDLADPAVRRNRK